MGGRKGEEGSQEKKQRRTTFAYRGHASRELEAEEEKRKVPSSVRFCKKGRQREREGKTLGKRRMRREGAGKY